MTLGAGFSAVQVMRRVLMTLEGFFVTCFGHEALALGQSLLDSHGFCP